MAVFRVEKNSGYTVMSNHHLRNRALSLKAKGLLSQMLSLPEDWDYTLQGLARINRESIDAIHYPEVLTHINTYVIIPNKSTAISVKKRFCAVLFPAKIYRPATHPIILPSVSPDKILRLYCVGGIFFLGKPYLGIS